MFNNTDYPKDFGFYMYNQTKQNLDPTIWLIPKMTFWAIAVIDKNLFSITSNTVVDGEPYAMTIDFDKKIFESIVRALPEDKSKKLQSFFEQLNDFPSILRFDEEPISLQFRIKLGEYTQGDGEDFIPFIAIDVSKIDPSL